MKKWIGLVLVVIGFGYKFLPIFFKNKHVPRSNTTQALLTDSRQISPPTAQIQKLFRPKRSGVLGVRGDVQVHIYKAPMASLDGQKRAFLLEEVGLARRVTRLEVWNANLSEKLYGLPLAASQIVGFSPDGNKILLVGESLSEDKSPPQGVHFIIVDLRQPNIDDAAQHILIPHPIIEGYQGLKGVNKEQSKDYLVEILFEQAAWFSNEEIAVCLKLGSVDTMVGGFHCSLYKKDDDRWVKKSVFLDIKSPSSPMGTQIEFLQGQRKGIILTDEDKLVMFDEKGRTHLNIPPQPFSRIYEISSSGKKTILYQQKQYFFRGYDLVGAQKHIESNRLVEVIDFALDLEPSPWVAVTYYNNQLDILSWQDGKTLQTIPGNCSLVGSFFSGLELYVLCNDGRYQVYKYE